MGWVEFLGLVIHAFILTRIIGYLLRKWGVKNPDTMALAPAFGVFAVVQFFAVDFGAFMGEVVFSTALAMYIPALGISFIYDILKKRRGSKANFKKN